MTQRQRHYDHVLDCEYCGEIFHAAEYNAKYCSQKCRYAIQNDRRKFNRQFTRIVQAVTELSDTFDLRKKRTMTTDELKVLQAVHVRLDYLLRVHNKYKEL